MTTLGGLVASHCGWRANQRRRRRGSNASRRPSPIRLKLGREGDKEDASYGLDTEFALCEYLEKGARRLHVISKKKLEDFWRAHADAKAALIAWHNAAEQATWHNLDDVRQTYASADVVGKWTIFNIRGNRFRLIVVIHYNRQKLFIRRVLTHAEYNRGDWKQD